MDSTTEYEGRHRDDSPERYARIAATAMRVAITPHNPRHSAAHRSLLLGLEQSAAGNVEDLGDFTQYVEAQS